MNQERILKIRGTNVLSRLIKATTKVKVLEGGSGSSKTISIIQYLIAYCEANRGQSKKITIARAKLTWLKASVYEDFVQWVKHYELYDVNNHNKSELKYILFGNTISFKGLDEDQKVHGPRQDITWVNEAVESTKGAFNQLAMRTNEEIILDYNPSYTEHWIYDSIIPREDCTYIHSTLLDNDFLPSEQRKEILSYDPSVELNNIMGTADQNLWEVYGLGKRASIKDVIYTNWGIVDNMPEDYKWIGYGLDYGYTNDPTALIEVSYAQGQLWLNERIYKKGLTNLPPLDNPGHRDNISYHLDLLGIVRSETVGDSAEPKSNAELGVKDAVKGPGSVQAGIDKVRRYKLNVTARSINLIKELRNYKYKRDEKEDKVTNTPIDKFNHALDAVRYIVNDKVGKRTGVRKMNRV